MNQASIAKLYNTTLQNITIHIRKIYADGELEEGQLVSNTYKFKLREQGR